MDSVPAMLIVDNLVWLFIFWDLSQSEEGRCSKRGKDVSSGLLPACKPSFSPSVRSGNFSVDGLLRKPPFDL